MNMKRTQFQHTEVTELEFLPRLRYKDLCLYTRGTHQMKRKTHDYYTDHVNHSEDFEFEVVIPSYNIDF